MGTKIEWCDLTWNPVWGCLNKCSYCYARKIAKRFAKTIAHKECLVNSTQSYFKKLDDIKKFIPAWLESNFNKSFSKTPKRIFVNSMSDIYFWDPAWMHKVTAKIYDHPKHTFIFLTKRPEVYERYTFPDNCILGVTVTGFDDHLRAFAMLDQEHTVMVSAEPILDNDILGLVPMLDWLIMGLETGRRNIFVPEPEIVESVVNICRGCNTAVFMKDSMKRVWPGKLIREFPILRQALR